MCDEAAWCSDTDGSYECRCKLGFSGDGRTCAGEEKFPLVHSSSHFPSILPSIFPPSFPPSLIVLFPFSLPYFLSSFQFSFSLSPSLLPVPLSCSVLSAAPSSSFSVPSLFSSHFVPSFPPAAPFLLCFLRLPCFCSTTDIASVTHALVFIQTSTNVHQATINVTTVQSVSTRGAHTDVSAGTVTSGMERRAWVRLTNKTHTSHYIL